MSEIDSDPSIFSQGLVLAHFAALVKGHGTAHLALKAIENRGKGLRDRVSFTNGQLPRATKRVERSTRGRPERGYPANDEVSFPGAVNSRMGTSTGLWSIKVMSGMDDCVYFYRAPVCEPVSAAQQIQQAGAELSPRHGIQCGVDGFMGKTDRISHTSQCARDLHRTQALAKTLQHGHPERVARFQLALPARFTSQHTRSSISGHTAVASRNGALAQLSSPPIASNLTANGRPGSLQTGSDPCRPHP